MYKIILVRTKLSSAVGSKEASNGRNRGLR